MLFQLWFCYRYDGTLLHVVWNLVPFHLEQDSIIAVTTVLNIVNSPIF